MSSLRSAGVSFGVLALSAGSLLAGCEMPRPRGFTPTRQVIAVGNPDVFGDGGGDPGGATGGMQKPPDGLPPVITGDGGTAPPPGSPMAKAQGYYYFRTDIEFTYSQTQQGVTLEVFNRVSHTGLTRVVASGEGLRGIERTCHIFYQHECKRSCDTLTTTIAPSAVALYRGMDLPRVYTLTNNGTEFVTDSNSLLLGWDGPADPLPTSLSDKSIWDADGSASTKGLYVNVKTDGLPSSPFSPSSLNCYYNTVERFTSAYNGKLASDGSLNGVNAILNTTGSAAKTLQTAGGGLCSPSDTNPPVSRTTVRFARVNPDDEVAFWNCPDRETFRGKLADP